MSQTLDIPDLREYEDCFGLLKDTIAKASKVSSEAQGLLHTKDSEKKNEQLQASQHVRQLRKLQRPVSRETASVPHVFTLLWRGCRGGVRAEINIPPSLVSVSKDSHPAFMFTNSKGVVELLEGPQATETFLHTLSKRKKQQLSPIAIHHTSTGSATLYFTRRAVKIALKSSPHTFNYMQKYIENKTHSPELLCVVFRPGKPTKFYIVVQRHIAGRESSPSSSAGKARLNSIIAASNAWLLNRSDHVKSEILDCTQADASLSHQSEQVYSLLSSFHIPPITELITDFLRDKTGKWVFKSVVNIVIETSKEQPQLLRPRTASSESHPSLSLMGKIKVSPQRPKQYAFSSASSLLSTTLMKGKKDDRVPSPMKKPIVNLKDIESRLKSITIPKPPQLKTDSLPGFRPGHMQRFAEVQLSDTPSLFRPPPSDLPKLPDPYKAMISNELSIVSEHYDTMRRVVKEFHDRRANPKRCIYYYPDSFWREVAAFVVTKLQEDPKTFPMYYRMEAEELMRLILQLISDLRTDVFPVPISIQLLELCVELSLPRLDPEAFVELLREGFRTCRMREDEIEVAVGVYRDNLRRLLSLNWKKSFSSFLTKKVMSPEFLEKVMYLREIEVKSVSDHEDFIEEQPLKALSAACCATSIAE